MICLNETPETLITQGDLQQRIDFSGCTSQRLSHQRTCRFLQRTLSRYMHQCGSVSKVSPRAKMAQDICSVPSTFPVISQLSTNVSSILSYSGMPILLIRKTYFFP